MPQVTDKIKKSSPVDGLDTAYEIAAVAENSYGGGLKNLLVTFIMLQLIMASIAFIFVKFYLDPKIRNTLPQRPESPAAAGPGTVHLIEDITFIPAVSGTKKSFSASIGLEIALSGQEGALNPDGKTGRFRTLSTRARDVMTAVLSSKSPEEFDSPRGRVSLRNEILDKLNLALAPDSIRGLYFLDYNLP